MAFHALLPIRDEEDIIAQSLHHLLLWADFIHIFDTGSTDKTWDIVNQLAAQHPQIRLIGREPVYFNDMTVRSFLFARSREHMRQGDWVLRCDADEFHHVLPPQFVREQMQSHETAAYRQYYDFQFTESDLAAWEQGNETMEDRMRPIAERRHWFTVSDEPEPRLFRYREAMHWAENCSFPMNAGFVAHKRLPIRHYPHRDPDQMNRRCKLRALMLAFPASRQTWQQANTHHWGEGDWRHFVVADHAPGLMHWDETQELPLSSSNPQIAPFRKRLVQRLAHGLVIPWLDHCRPVYVTGKPDPIPAKIQEEIRLAMLDG